MKKRFVTGWLFVMVILSFFACKDNSLEKQRKREIDKLNTYIRDNYAGMEPRPSGLYYIEQQKGTGDSIRIGDIVQVYFDMYTLDSDVPLISTGPYEPLKVEVKHPGNLSYSASDVEDIRALHEALTYMKSKSKARLIFDSGLGFGQYGTPGIVGFTPLIMDLEVYKVYPAQPQE